MCLHLLPMAWPSFMAGKQPFFFFFSLLELPSFWDGQRMPIMVSPNICRGVGLLDHIVVLYLVFFF